MLWHETPRQMARRLAIAKRTAAAFAAGVRELNDKRTFKVRDQLRELGGKCKPIYGKGGKTWVWLIPITRWDEAIALLDRPQSDGQVWADRYESNPEAWPGIQPGGY